MYSVVTFLSIASWWLCSWIFSLMDANGTRGVTAHMFGSSTTWFTLAVVIWACVLRIIAWKLYKRSFRPQLRHVVQEVQLVTQSPQKLLNWAAPSDDAAGASKTLHPSLSQLLDEKQAPPPATRQRGYTRQASEFRIACVALLLSLWFAVCVRGEEGRGGEGGGGFVDTCVICCWLANHLQIHGHRLFTRRHPRRVPRGQAVKVRWRVCISTTASREFRVARPSHGAPRDAVRCRDTATGTHARTQCV